MVIISLSDLIFLGLPIDINYYRGKGLHQVPEYHCSGEDIFVCLYVGYCGGKMADSCKDRFKCFSVKHGIFHDDKNAVKELFNITMNHMIQCR